MKTFEHVRAASLADALKRHGGAAGTHYLAGGTTQVDLMKLAVIAPERVIDIGGLRDGRGAIEERDGTIRIGAFTTMRQAAESPLLRARMPVLVETLELAASRQLRSMATLGGNVLQRTRCGYYRDTSWTACNRRVPGSGCAAITGSAWAHAVLGTSEACIAIYPGDFAQALIALDALIEIDGPAGPRTLPFTGLHRLPADAPQRETQLAPGELITAFRIPVMPWFVRSRYVKVRDRASYEFALAAAAVALDLAADGSIREARIALGGSATVPWRARAAEDAIKGKALDREMAAKAAEAAFATAQVRPDTKSRLELGKATLVRALLETAAMETS